jgi:hypothetical protein
MAYGVFSANKVQIGRETTAGTAVAATVLWRGPATDIEDAREIVMVDENVGLLVPTGRNYVAQLGATISLPETEATFEHIPHVFEGGIKAVSPSGTGPYTRSGYAPGTASANTIKTYTIESGNAIAGDGNEMEYSFVESFTLSGKTGEAWKVSSNWRGRQKTVAPMTGALSVAAVEEMLFGKTVFYIDATGGSVGSTQKTGVLLEASIDVETGIQPVHSADGVLYFTAHKMTPPSLEFTITMELENDNGIVAAERAFWASQAVRLFQLTCTGTSSRSFVGKWAGKYTSIGAYQNSNGNTTVQFSGEAVYSSTDSLFFDFSVINNVAAL